MYVLPEGSSFERKIMKKTIKLISMIFIMALIIITHTACGGEEPVSKSDFCLDTACDIAIYDDMKKADAEAILDEAFALMRDYENLLSRTISTSDVAKINDAKGKAIKVSTDTAEAIKMAVDISEASGGVFDITVGKVTNVWDFKSENPQVPEAAILTAALPHIDYKNISLGNTNQITLQDSEAQIDLGGIAKGYIADKVCAFLEEEGVTSAVINLGGNVVVIGEKAEATPWTIGIERPFTDRTEIIGTIQVTDATVVTSGIYERKFEQDGVIYHHILDPATAYPAKTDLEAVTITAAKGNSGLCDALSTACLILGKDKAPKFIEKIQAKYPEAGLEAAFIDNNGNIVQTDGMKITFIEE